MFRGKFSNFRYLIFAGLILILGLPGCAVKSSGIIATGNNIYVTSKQEGAFPSGNEPLLSEAISEANTFCSNQGKELNIIDTNERSGPFILGNYPKATVTFSCESRSPSN